MQPVPTNVPQNEPDKTHKHSVDSFMHSSQCPPLKTSVFGPFPQPLRQCESRHNLWPRGNPPTCGTRSKAVHPHHNDQLAYHLWISAVSMLQCMASLSTWGEHKSSSSPILYHWTVRLLIMFRPPPPSLLSHLVCPTCLITCYLRSRYTHKNNRRKLSNTRTKF